MNCRQNFHNDQYDKETSVIKSRVESANMKTAFQNKDLVILIFKPNRNPLSFNILPSFVAFCALGREIYGFFPHESNIVVQDEILAFLSCKIPSGVPLSVFVKHA